MSIECAWCVAEGLTLVGEVSGDCCGATVVVMHGGGQTRHSWSSLHRALTRDGYAVINYDARGHGNSDWSSECDYSFATQARDLMAILRNVTGPIALVGASMGGIAAMHAVASGFRPRALVLVDIVLYPSRAGIERVRRFMTAHNDGFASVEEAIDAVEAYNPNRRRPTDSKGILRNLRARPNGRLYWHYDPMVISSDVDNDLEAMALAVDGLKAAQNIPTLLIRGRASDVVTAEGIARFKQVIPALELVEVASAGHMVAGDNNDPFNKAVIDFLSRQSLLSRE